MIKKLFPMQESQKDATFEVSNTSKSFSDLFKVLVFSRTFKIKNWIHSF